MQIGVFAPTSYYFKTYRQGSELLLLYTDLCHLWPSQMSFRNCQADDTLAEKYGAKFQFCSKLFDHIAHNSSTYLNIHWFVSVMLHVPVKGSLPLCGKAIPFMPVWQLLIRKNQKASVYSYKRQNRRDRHLAGEAGWWKICSYNT